MPGTVWVIKSDTMGNYKTNKAYVHVFMYKFMESPEQ